MNRAWRSGGGQVLGWFGLSGPGQTPGLPRRLSRSSKVRLGLAVVVVLLGLAIIGAAINGAGDSDDAQPAGLLAAQSDVPAAGGNATGSVGGSADGSTAFGGQGGDGVGGDASAGRGDGGDASGGDGGNANAQLIGDAAPDTVTNAAPGTTSQVPPAAAFDRKIVRNATLELTVQDVDQAITAARDAAVASGGYVFSSSTSYRGDFKYGQLVIQVPFDQFEAVMSSLRAVPGLERIANEAVSSQDFTTEYVDTEARIRNLQATEQSYVTLLGEATEIQDILLIQGYLTDVRGQIETLQGRLKYLDSVTTYSSITVSFAPVPPVPSPSPEPVAGAERNAFVEAADESWEASLAVVETLGAGLVRVLVFSWWLLPILLIAFVVMRRRGRGGVPTIPDLPAAPAAPSGN
jgi:hypothetical protein